MKKLLAAVALATAVLVGTAGTAEARHHGSEHVKKVVITHAVVTPTLVTGSGLGMVRTFSAPITVNGVADAGSYFAGTLTTVMLETSTNQDVRSSNLTFVVKKPENQLVVGGVAVYPADGSTLAVGAKTTRPITGGSGKYSGATGWVVSTNLGANGWKHVFHVITH